MEEREILLNLMYAGEYLESKDNIGHEIINLFQCDNGNNYIYVLPWGMMDKQHNDRLDAILLARRHSASKIEILAKAVGLKQLAYVKTTGKKDWASLHQVGLKYVINNQVKYGGVYLKDIPFGDNERAVFITFQADKIIKARSPIYITTAKPEHNNSCTFLLPDVKNFSRQSLKMYFSNQKHHLMYKLLHKLINTPTLWGQPTAPIKATKETYLSNKTNFMQIIKKEYDELTFSNLFAYIFESSPTGFQKFAHKCLGASNWGKIFEIKREYKNIDILLADGKNVIIIENKIKSGLNGKIEDKDQLDKYWKIIAKDPAYKKLNVYGFVFVPDYNSAVMGEVQKQHKGKYTCMPYSQVYKFFDQYRNLYHNVPYYDEFLSAIKKHTNLVDNYLEEETYKKFLAAIRWGRFHRAK
ncbi:PD-(D/E)XK nuclease family protein [Candidatus Avelusimicrobium fimicolum]|jgi:hypothetical protein|uniref:PD-(D/E)XK nuclease family protein n=1 Tax=Candidatus Avelusimicrobium fimicolum TaxID=3416216 RepID=UPI003D0A2B32